MLVLLLTYQYINTRSPAMRAKRLALMASANIFLLAAAPNDADVPDTVDDDSVGVMRVTHNPTKGFDARADDGMEL
jgi:hypothetical protein